MRLAPWLGAISLMAAGPATASSIDLPNVVAQGSASFWIINNPNFPVTDAEFGFGSANSAPFFSVFDFIDLTADDAGRLLVATPLGAPDFDAVEGLLTNGIDDFFLFSLTTPGFSTLPGAASEFGLFGGRDLSGFDLDAIALKLDNIQLDSSMDLGIAVRRIDFTLAAIGRPAVPEPIESGLLGLGLTLLSFSRLPRPGWTRRAARERD